MERNVADWWGHFTCLGQLWRAGLGYLWVTMSLFHFHLQDCSWLLLVFLQQSGGLLLFIPPTHGIFCLAGEPSPLAFSAVEYGLC